MIDLGPNWNYEYRIISPSDGTNSKQIGRHGKHQLPLVNHASRIRKEEERLRKDEERLHQGEERLHREEERIRKEAEKLRLYKDHRIPHETDKKVKKPEPLEERHSKHRTPDIEDRKERHILREKTSELTHNKNKHHKEKEEKKNEPTKEKDADETASVKKKESNRERKRKSKKKHETKSSSDSEPDVIGYDGWSDNSAEVVISTPKKATMFDMYDDATINTPKTKEKEEHNEKAKLKSGPVNEDAASFSGESIKNHKSGHSKLRQQKEQLADSGHEVKLNVTTTEKVIVTNATKPTIPTTTQVTTVRTEEIYSAPHKVKDDDKINEFTNHIFKQNLKVFDSIKHKTNQYYLRKQVDVLAKSYEDKFREFLKETRHQNIKTRLGTQKVILNTIDMSNRILKRLINYMIGDMDRKGVLRNNVATANIFQKEVEKEQNLELTHACKKFGICRTGDGFPEFLTDLLTYMLKSDNKKFKQSIDAFTEVVKSTDFYKVLDSDTERKLKSSIENMELLSVQTLRPVMMIIKNIIWNKNKPIIIHSDSRGSRVNSTLAFLEIIDLLDQKLPRNEANILEWNDIRNSMRDFAEGKRYDVQDIMEAFVKHLKKAVRSMDAPNRRIISKNLNQILG